MSSHLFRVAEHAIAGQHIREYPTGARSDDDVLQLAVKHYTPLGLSQGDSNEKPLVTVIAAHANGVPKECYEPLYDELLQAARAHGFGIRGIWAADTVHQGASYVLNEDTIGDDWNWYDHARDLLALVNHFRADIQRPIVGLGHSFGATILVHLSLMHPRLFHSLALVEPVIFGIVPNSANPAMPSTLRRDRWPSRAAAAQALRRNSFFASWDARAFDRYAEFNLRETPTRLYPDEGAVAAAPTPEAPDGERPVTLTTTKHQEAWSFMRPQLTPLSKAPEDWNTLRLLAPDLDLAKEGRFTMFRAEIFAAHASLPALRPSVLWVFGAQSYLSVPALREDKVRRTGAGVGGSGGVEKGRVKELVLDAGHMVPFEKLAEVSTALAEWWGGEIGRWTREEELLKGLGTAKSERDGLVVSKLWEEKVRLPANTLRPMREKL